jgi:hypothetical protein
MHLRSIEWGNSKKGSREVDHHFDRRPLGVRSTWLFRTVVFARRAGGIDFIAEGHWIIDFRRSIFAHF